MSEPVWRLLRSRPATGAWNMAVDDVLLQGVAFDTAPPTLRFYAWTPPCLSLGYFQPFDVVDLDACLARGVDVVRRPTGGRAILHDREVTYSLALPAAVLGHDWGILPSYYRISRALQAALRELGIETALAPETAGPAMSEHGPICFDRPSAHEILLHGRKLVGSAQVRRGAALLQHGSILIEPRLEAMFACLRLRQPPAAADAGRHGLMAAVAGLGEAGIDDPEQIAAVIGSGIAQEFRIRLEAGGLTNEESAAAAELARSRYASASWTERLAPSPTQKTTRTR